MRAPPGSIGRATRLSPAASGGPKASRPVGDASWDQRTPARERAVVVKCQIRVPCGRYDGEDVETLRRVVALILDRLPPENGVTCPRDQVWQ